MARRVKLPRRTFLHLAAGAAALPAVSRFAWACCTSSSQCWRSPARALADAHPTDRCPASRRPSGVGGAPGGVSRPVRARTRARYVRLPVRNAVISPKSEQIGRSWFPGSRLEITPVLNRTSDLAVDHQDRTRRWFTASATRGKRLVQSSPPTGDQPDARALAPSHQPEAVVLDLVTTDMQRHRIPPRSLH
jgi:hypothetical protein